MIVYAADVGSLSKKKFAWARCTTGDTDTGKEIDKLAHAIADDLRSGNQVALGFECPLFVPVPTEHSKVGLARAGEGNRAFTAGAGASAAVTGMVQLAWLLRQIHTDVPSVRASVDVATFNKKEVQLLIWEAFVSGASKTETHEGDALKAAKSFMDMANSLAPSPVTAENTFSIAGALLAWSGLGSAEEMYKQCFVIKP